jgi:hypothetical protein
MHKWRGFWKGTFSERSMYEYFKQEIYPIHFKYHFNKLKATKHLKVYLNSKDSRIIPSTINKETKIYRTDPDEDLLI